MFASRLADSAILGCHNMCRSLPQSGFCAASSQVDVLVTPSEAGSVFTIARRLFNARSHKRSGLRSPCFGDRPPEMDGRPEPRTRSRQTKLRRGPSSAFCLVEQGYGICGARDEPAHAGQQQQLVDQLGHDSPPPGVAPAKTTTGSRNFGSATTCGPTPGDVDACTDTATSPRERRRSRSRRAAGNE
jgi:hypothetical protein